MADFVNVIKKDQEIKKTLKDAIEMYGNNLVDEVTLVLLGKNSVDEIGAFLMKQDRIYLYHAKKDRIYDKELPFHAISNTLIELAMEEQDVLIFDVNERMYFKEPFFGRNYSDTEYKTMIVIPILDGDTLLGINLLYSYQSKPEVSLDHLNKITSLYSKILKTAIVFDQVIPQEVTEIKATLYGNNPSFLVRLDDEMVLINEALSKKINVSTRLISYKDFTKLVYGTAKSLVEMKDDYRQTSTHNQRSIIEIGKKVQIQGQSFLLGEINIDETSIPASKEVEPSFEELITRKQQDKSKFSVFLCSIEFHKELFSIIPYEVKQNLIHQFREHIHQVFQKEGLIFFLGEFECAVFMEGCLDFRIISRFDAKVRAFEVSKALKFLGTPNVYTGVVRFGKDAKVGSIVLERIDLVRSLMKENLEILLYQEDLLKTKYSRFQALTMIQQLLSTHKSVLSSPIKQSLTNQIWGNVRSVDLSKIKIEDERIIKLLLDSTLKEKLNVYLMQECIKSSTNSSLFQVMGVSINSLIQDSFYQHTKDDLQKYKGSPDHLILKLEGVEQASSFMNKKIERYRQLGLLISYVNMHQLNYSLDQFMHFSFDVIMMDANWLKEQLSNTTKKLIVSNHLSTMIELNKMIIFTNVTPLNKNLLPKDTNIYYMEEMT